MCCGPYDNDYPTFGGKNQRVDRAYGRVGSIFSDPTARQFGESADSNLVPAPPIRTPGGDDDGADDNSDADADIEKFKRELESLKPKNNQPGLPDDLKGGRDQLPEPDEVKKDPTAMRLMRQRLLKGQWR